MVEYLVARGADVHAIDAHGNQCLHCCAGGPPVATTRYLLEAGVSDRVDACSARANSKRPCADLIVGAKSGLVFSLGPFSVWIRESLQLFAFRSLPTNIAHVNITNERIDLYL